MLKANECALHGRLATVYQRCLGLPPPGGCQSVGYLVSVYGGDRVHRILKFVSRVTKAIPGPTA